MADVSLDDIQIALVPVSKKSASVYKSVINLYKSIFRAAKESRIVENNPTIHLTAKGGGVPQKDKEALTDEQAYRICTFDWMEPTFLELQIYSLRHIQEHAAQLNLVLGEHGVTGQDWVAQARDKA